VTQVGDVTFPVSEKCNLVSNAASRRIDFLAPNGVYAIRFFSQPAWRHELNS
jgi:hypothetical protein